MEQIYASRKHMSFVCTEKTEYGKLTNALIQSLKKYDMKSYLKNKYMMCISFGLQCGDIKMYYVSQVPVAKHNKK